jgi:hypothetical protein
MGLPEAEQGATGTPRNDRDEADGTRRFHVGGDQPPRVSVQAISGALRVLGEEDTNQVSVRAVKPNGETVPLDLVADVQVRLNGEITIKMRPAGEIQRQVRRITKSFDFGRGDLFDNLGEVIDALAAMKSAGNSIDRVRLEVTVPHRCDLALTTASGAVQVGRVEGSVQVQSASGSIDCARIGGKLTVRSASGSLRLGDITGTASVQTMSGDVTTRGIDGNLVIHTASGDAQGQDLVGLVGFKSQSGGLLVLVALVSAGASLLPGRMVRSPLTVRTRRRVWPAAARAGSPIRNSQRLRPRRRSRRCSRSRSRSRRSLRRSMRTPGILSASSSIRRNPATSIPSLPIRSPGNSISGASKFGPRRSSSSSSSIAARQSSSAWR